MIVLAIALLAQAAVPAPAPLAGVRPAKEVWEERCIACHGEDGKAQTKKGRELKAKDFTRPRWQRHTSDEEIVKVMGAIGNHHETDGSAISAVAAAVILGDKSDVHAVASISKTGHRPGRGQRKVRVSSRCF